MALLVAFVLLTFVTCSYAGWRGGGPERSVAALFFCAVLASAFAPAEPHQSVNWAVLYIDAAFFLGVTVIALFSDRFWPIWIAALQLIALASHGIRAYDAGILPVVYRTMITKLGYIMLAILAVGAFRHYHRSADRNNS
ncbi:MAG: hypothetical protein QM688_06105 [Sphingomonas bacterium]